MRVASGGRAGAQTLVLRRFARTAHGRAAPSPAVQPGVSDNYTYKLDETVDAKLALQSIEGRDLLRRNTTGSMAIFEAAARHDCKRVVFASTCFAYGFMNGGMDAAAFAPRYLPIDEAHPLVPTEHYGLSKLLGEQQIDMLLRASGSTRDVSIGPTFVVLRFPNSIWRDAWHFTPWDSPLSSEGGGMHGGPIGWATVHEDDVIAGMVRGLELSDRALGLGEAGPMSKVTSFNLVAPVCCRRHIVCPLGCRFVHCRYRF